MSGVLEHLEALRRMFFKIFAVFALFCVPGWIFSGKMVDSLLKFAAPEGFKLHYFSLMEPFFVRLEVTMVAAAVVSFPFTVKFIWDFIRPALRDDEVGKLAFPMFFIIILALLGGGVALLGMVPAVMQFSISLAGNEFTPVIGNFVSLVLGLVIAGMLVFQFPLIVYALLSLKVVSLVQIKKMRRWIIVVILIVAGFLTPPDVASQVLMALPCYLLFEAALWLYSVRHKEEQSNGE